MSKLSNYKAIALLCTLFLLGALLKPVAASYQETATVDVADQYGSTAVTLYFLEETEQYLVPVSRRVDAETEQTPTRALEELIAGPEAGPLVSLLAAGTKVADLSIGAGEANIALTMPNAEKLSSKIVDAIRWTMTEFEEVDQVAVTVNGRAIDANGEFTEIVTALARPESINSEMSAVGHPATLYFGYALDPSLLIPMTVYLDADAGDAQTVETVEKLLLGPPAGSNLVSTIPDNVSLLDAQMNGVIAKVDFSEELVIAYRLDQANALHVRKAVIASLTSLPEVYAGSIEIGGSSLLYFTCQNAVMEHPQTKPWAINDEFYM